MKVLKEAIKIERQTNVELEDKLYFANNKVHKK